MDYRRINKHRMGRRKTGMSQPGKPPDRHRPRVIVSLPQVLADALQRIADQQFKSLTAVVVDICREYAEQNGLLPKSK